MVKIVYIVLLISFIFIGSYKSKDDSHDIAIPQVLNPVSNNLIPKNNSTSVNNNLPEARKAREIVVDQSNKEYIDKKMKETAFTFRDDYKTESPRLSKEEIAAAPVVAEFTMNVNGRDAYVVVVEKDGKTYDASDGVRIYIPEGLKTHSKLLDFLYSR